MVAGCKLPEIAARMMRRFAQSLPGLGSSSPEYLWRNVLAGSDHLRVNDREIVMEFSPRPLAIVLHMAGFQGLKVRLPWMPDVQVTLELRKE